jgi:hypothetical protein
LNAYHSRSSESSRKNRRRSSVVRHATTRGFLPHSKTRQHTVKSSMKSSRSFVDERCSSIADVRIAPKIGPGDCRTQ